MYFTCFFVNYHNVRIYFASKNIEQKKTFITVSLHQYQIKRNWR